jgi:hypothetical protein
MLLQYSFPNEFAMWEKSILLNEWIMMANTREDDFVSRAAGECRNSSARVIAIRE